MCLRFAKHNMGRPLSYSLQCYTNKQISSSQVKACMTLKLVHYKVLKILIIGSILFRVILHLIIFFTRCVAITIKFHAFLSLLRYVCHFGFFDNAQFIVIKS